MIDPDVTAMGTANRPVNRGVSLDDDTGRLDAVAKVTGRAKYGRDVYFPGTLFVGYVRCPYGAAKLISTNEEAALRVRGVVEVNIGHDRGLYHGQPVGGVAAESRLSLQRGLRALDPQWEIEPLKTLITDAVAGPPQLTAGVKKLLESADHVLEAIYSTQVQTHCCLETHGASIDHRA